VADIPNFETWTKRLSGEIETLARAPYFVVNPPALRQVRDELHRIRVGHGSPGNGSDPIVDNARALAATVDHAGAELSPIQLEHLELFVRERLVEVSMR
jgi:hypothetical protein